MPASVNLYSPGASPLALVPDSDISLDVEGLHADTSVAFTLSYTSPDNSFTTSDTIGLRVVDSLAITGRLTYELPASRYINSSVHPLADRRAQAVYVTYTGTIGGTSKSSTTYTDDNGFYCLQFTNDVLTATAIRFFVAAEAEPAGDGQPVYEVVSQLRRAQAVYEYMAIPELGEQQLVR